jgi:hypothetical protein
LPQLPQLRSSAEVSTHSTPAPTWHETVGAAQVAAHMPWPLQLWPAGQVTPHAPQLALSLAVLTQVVPHSFWVAVQLPPGFDDEQPRVKAKRTATTTRQ